MKKLLSLALLVGTLTPQLAVNAMDTVKEESLSKPVITVFNATGQAIAINYITPQKWDPKLGEKQDFTSHPMVPNCAPIRLERSIVDFSANYFSTTEGIVIPKKVLAAIADSSGQIIIGSMSQEKGSPLYYEINTPGTIRIFNNSEEKLTIVYIPKAQEPTLLATDHFQPTVPQPTVAKVKPSNLFANPKECCKINKPISRLTIVRGKLTLNAKSSLDIPAQELEEISTTSAEIIISCEKSSGKLSYKINTAKVSFSSLTKESSLPVGGEPEPEYVEIRGAGRDINSGDQQNCIIS